MIPKVIHYCWFGNNEKSDKIKFCINTWKKILPDYKFRKWSEKDLDKLGNNIYIKQAYSAKKYAFVSDVFRLYALYTEGGIYLDTDVEVRKSFNQFLDLDFFIGSEKNGNFKSIGTAVIGSSKNNKIIKDMLSLYDDITFIKPDGNYDLLPNTVRLVDVLKNTGKISEVYSNDKPIKLNNNSYIYPDNFFCIDDYDSFAVHHFEASWVDAWVLKKNFIFTICKNKRLVYQRYKQIKNVAFEYPKNIKYKLFDFSYKKKKIILFVTKDVS